MISIKHALYHWAAIVFGGMGFTASPGFWAALEGDWPRQRIFVRWAVRSMATNTFLGDCKDHGPGSIDWNRHPGRQADPEGWRARQYRAELAKAYTGWSTYND